MRFPWVSEMRPWLAVGLVLSFGGLAVNLASGNHGPGRLVGFGLMALGLAAMILCLIFFRDPERRSLAEPDRIVSPADGTIQQIEVVMETRFLGETARRVSIFMNLTNVHVQRMPADGRLGWTEYQPGRFDPAFLQSAKKFNEQRWYGFEGSGRKFVVVQIAGLVARRIVSWIKPEAVYARGERLGMIAFGSEVDLYLPLGVELTVRPGQRVRAGETVVGKWR